MKMARFAALITSKELQKWKDCRLVIGRSTVSCVAERKSFDQQYVKLMVGCAKLEGLPNISNTGMVIINSTLREEIENSMEHYSNLLAIANSTSRNLRSVSPCVALAAETHSEAEFLAGAKGIHIDPINTIISGSLFPFDIEKHVSDLQDRFDGVAIMAEALSYKQASGTFRDNIRLFERAFKLAGRRLSEPLANYLSTGRGGYTKAEIDNWITKRDGVTHADVKATLFESDVAWVAERTMQAAYDVLLNKTTWRSDDVTRRDAWSPASGTSDADGNLWGTTGNDWNITITAYDDYRRFPLYLATEGFGSLPAGWWVGNARTTDAAP